ncbi:MAG: MBL fold metallo-hydrolase [Bacteroidetes bacterium]|nr:MBL fold metallo-hydrolase [Bacteroidota bacterium]MCY4206221.1 MBL fold metallo-hydrolase [Bacteroidota bacterium]
MEFISLGRSNDIGASSHYLRIGGHGIVLDAGADPNEEGPASLPDFFPLENRRVDHAFITHAHHDHIGGIPALNAKWPMARLHLTPATRTLTTLMLYSSARLQRRKFYEGSSPFPALFEEEDIDDVYDMFRTHNYDQWIDLGSEHLRAKFYYSGHLLGSAGILLKTSKKQRIFYTSDTRTEHQTIIPGGSYPSEPVDVLIMESTLGADPVAETVTRAEEEIRFAQRLRTVLDRGGSILVPVFMLGRAQEILALLGRFKKEKLIDPEIPIYTAGGLREVSKIYDDYRMSTPRMDPDFEVYSVQQLRFPRTHKARRRALNRPGIHVLTSGMMIERTLSHQIAMELLEHEKHAIFFVGFSKDDLPAGRLLHAAKSGEEGILLNTDRGMQPIACEVERFRFSGHSHRKELTALATKLQPKTIILIHGETDARAWMKEELGKRCPEARIFAPDQGELMSV